MLYGDCHLTVTDEYILGVILISLQYNTIQCFHSGMLGHKAKDKIVFVSFPITYSHHRVPVGRYVGTKSLILYEKMYMKM
jgi:hypothetical protein